MLIPPLSTMVIFLWIFLSCSPSNVADHVATGREIKKFQHLPSPEWQDQIMYFIVTDRFMDGDTTNNDQGQGEYKKGDGGFWNGGDFKGITQKIPYIKKLGATAIWITPPVANQWKNPQKTGTGNHGYWARSFVEVDKHYGTLNDYRQLSASLHKNGIYLIQDVVVNHLGDFYSYNGPYDPDDVTKNFYVHDVPQPTQFPFMYNNALDSLDREMEIFHFTPNFHDHSDTIKRRLYQFADLDDLNTSNDLVRRTLRYSYNYWIKEAGVDGFRYDTPMMVEHDFWHDFLHSTNIDTPGIQPFATGMGKDHFLDFGETAYFPFPYDDAAERSAARYLGTPSRPEMTSVLNFPLQGSIRRVFQELGPTALMSYRLRSIAEHFSQPELLLNFIDNHDGARFLTKANRQSFQQALLFIMTIPGIPVIYYGTEQEFLIPRQTMFDGRAGSPDHDHFDTTPAAFEFVRSLITIRKEHDILRRGNLTVLKDSKSGPGILAYQLKYDDDFCLVVLNTSKQSKLIAGLQTDLEAGTTLRSVFSLDGLLHEFTVDIDGTLTWTIAPQSGMILQPERGGQLIETPSQLSIQTQIPRVINSAQIEISGESVGLDSVKVFVDGNFNKASSAIVKPSGNWNAKVDLTHLTTGFHTLVAASTENSGKVIASAPHEFNFNFPKSLATHITDVPGDDGGPKGTYSYPSHPSYQRQMDIREVKIYTQGTNLLVDLTMGEITQIWLPPNGFDHALINIYIDLPDTNGVSVLPFQNAVMPAGARWNYLISAGGFGTGTYSAAGATEGSAGTPTGPAPLITVDKEKKSISFQIASEAIGYPETLSGTRIYITTWDGGPASLRGLSLQPEMWSFSGGESTDPKIMDDTEIITLE